MEIVVRVVGGGADPVVECDSEVGKLTARWRGARPVAVGIPEDVELDVVGELVWEGSCIVAADRRDVASVVSGIVEDIEGDAVVVRVGSGLLSLEVQGDPPIGVVGQAVRIGPAPLEVWPTGV